MKPKRAVPPRLKQQTPQEVTDALLELVRTKFYQIAGVRFAQDKRHLLTWALLWPAREWFKPKGVAVPAERYREILAGIIVEAAAFQRGEIKYVPAWLARTIQSHFAVHGDEYYEEAKSARTLADQALSMLGKLPTRQGQSIDALAAAHAVLTAAKKPVGKTTTKGPVKQQLTLL